MADKPAPAPRKVVVVDTSKIVEYQNFINGHLLDLSLKVNKK